MEGPGEMGIVNFCLVDEKPKKRIDERLAQAQLVQRSAKAAVENIKRRYRGAFQKIIDGQ